MSEILEKFINDLRDEKNFPSDESSVKQYIVLRALSLLDWDIFNLKEVIPEYSIKGKRVDYCLKINDAPKVFIEVKNINEDLSNSSHQEQLLDYAFHEGVELAILTNGNTWEFYLPLTKGSWEQRKFFTIDIMQQEVDEVIKNFSDFLLKENTISDRALDTARSYLDIKLKQQLINRNLPKAWNKLISETDEALIDIINDSLESISGVKAKSEKIARFIQQNEAKFIILENETNIGQEKRKIMSKEKKETGYTRTGYTNKRIISFDFNDKIYHVGSWVAFLIKISELIYNSNKSEFNKIEALRGRKRKYFSTNKNEVVQPGKIGDTGYYVDTNLSANMIVKLVNRVLALFGYDKDALKINCN